MIQDRNIHRDAQALRKVISVPLILPLTGDNLDEPVYATQPRFNFRVSDLSVFVGAVNNIGFDVKLSAVRGFQAVGSPQLGQNTAPTFSIEAFFHANANDEGGSGFGSFGPTAAQAFSDPFTILDGFWGTVLIIANLTAESQIDTQAAGPIMSFGTEEIALANCPRVPNIDRLGRAAILTIQAVGGDFIAQTTNTDAALVAAFNTAPQDGHVATIPVSLRASPNAVLGQQLKDAAGESLLQGKVGDRLVLSVRTSNLGVPAIIDPFTAKIEYRPWPVGGEGLGDVSVSQTPSQFVP